MITMKDIIIISNLYEGEFFKEAIEMKKRTGKSIVTKEKVSE